MARKIIDFGNYTPVSSTYPYGQIKDDTGSNDGTPVNVLTNGDIQQFFAKMLADSGVTANSNPDNADNGFQLWESNLMAISANVAQVVILMLGSSYDTATGYVLSGLTSAFQDGFMLFDGKIYYVEAFSGGGSAPYGINRGSALGATQDTFLRAVIESDATPDMCLFADLVFFNSQTTISPSSFNTGWQGTPDVECTYSIDTNGYVHWDGKILTDTLSPSSTILATGGIPAEARPLVASFYHICPASIGSGSIGTTEFTACIQVYGDGRLLLKANPSTFGGTSGNFLDLTGLTYKVR